jgi:hypothetical protein
MLMVYFQIGTKRRVYQLELVSSDILPAAEENEIVDVSSEHEIGFRKHEESEDRK